MRYSKIKSIHLLLFLLLNGSFLMAQESDLISKYRWQNRQILIYADQIQPLQEQLAVFKADWAGMEDRDLIVWIIEENGSASRFKGETLGQKETEQLKQKVRRLAPEDQPFKFILIGKDGGSKMVSYQVVSLRALFTKIDKMPMRQSEMRRKSKN